MSDAWTAALQGVIGMDARAHPLRPETSPQFVGSAATTCESAEVMKAPGLVIRDARTAAPQGVIDTDARIHSLRPKTLTQLVVGRTCATSFVSTPASNEERRTGKTVDEIFTRTSPSDSMPKDMSVVASIDAHPSKKRVETLPTSGPTSRPPFKAESADGQSKSVPRSVGCP